jgi:hypothetical protein
MNPQIFTTIQQAVEVPVERAMDNVISALSTYLQSPMLAAFAMYVALIGIAILRGAVTDTFGDMLGRILNCLGGHERLGLRDLRPRPLHRHAAK